MLTHWTEHKGFWKTNWQDECLCIDVKCSLLLSQTSLDNNNKKKPRRENSPAKLQRAKSSYHPLILHLHQIYNLHQQIEAVLVSRRRRAMCALLLHVPHTPCANELHPGAEFLCLNQDIFNGQIAKVTFHSGIYSEEEQWLQRPGHNSLPLEFSLSHSLLTWAYAEITNIKYFLPQTPWRSQLRPIILYMHGMLDDQWLCNSQEPHHLKFVLIQLAASIKLKECLASVLKKLVWWSTFK